jgi:hypothetical protein
MSIKYIRLFLATLSFTLVFMLLSLVINHLILGEAHEHYNFFRPDDDARVFLGLPITSVVWSLLICLGYLKMKPLFSGKHNMVKGVKYGTFVFVCFVLCQEVFYYHFIQFELVIIIGSVLHYFLSFLLGGGLIAVLLK